MKSGFWKSDWFLGLAVAMLVFFASGSDLRAAASGRPAAAAAHPPVDIEL